jgi:acyl-CoA synthetase (AMP-forming)/AMP-acid ligase II
MLVRWTENASAERGIHFAAADERWDFWSYARLAELTRRIAGGLIAAGVRRNEVVLIVHRSSAEFVATFFGAILAGAIPSPVAPPTALNAHDDYPGYLRGLVAASRPGAMVIEDGLALQVGETAAQLGVKSLSVAALLAAHDDTTVSPRRERAAVAMLQFTSGSTGRARGVGVPFEALEANAVAIRTWLRATDGDAWASWLPMYHDMGLVGCLISPLLGANDIWLLQPEQFIRRPLRYLRCFGANGATITATPNFALDYIVRRVRPEALAGLDFSGWKAVVIGSERVDPRTLERFYQLLSPFGLQRRFLLPAYGMAEATLAVTGVALEDEWRSLRVDPSLLTLGSQIARCDVGGQVIVGCGRPLPRVAVTIVDEQGRQLPAGRVGEIVVRGPSVAAGYMVEGELQSQAVFVEGALHTGDAGFIADEELFVIGRLGDSLKIRGRSIFAEDLEAALCAADLPRYRLAVLLGVDHGVPTVVALFEQLEPDRVGVAEAILRQRTEGARLALVNGPKGTIKRTSSGKPKRRLLWRAFADKVFAGIVSEPSRAKDGAV